VDTAYNISMAFECLKALTPVSEGEIYKLCLNDY
jgi:hypothetical protein